MAAARSRETGCKIEDILPNGLGEMISKFNGLFRKETMFDFSSMPPEKLIVVEPYKITPSLLNIKYFTNTKYTNEEHTALICATVGDIFFDSAPRDFNPTRIFVQSLVLLFGSSVLDTSEIRKQLLGWGEKVVDDQINHSNLEMTQLYQHSMNQQTQKLLNLKDIKWPHSCLLAYCGAILLLSAKELNEASAKRWTERTIVELVASMGYTINPGQVVAFNHRLALMITVKFRCCHNIRATVVRLLMDASGQNSTIGSLAVGMLRLLAFSEMNHILMIQKYILGRYPELLAKGHLKLFIKDLRVAWDYLLTLDERERPFAKLLFTSNQTRALQGEGLFFCSGAAHAVRDYLHPALSNYREDSASPMQRSIRRTVTQYLLSLNTGGVPMT